MKKTVISALAGAMALGALADIPLEYYKSLDGLKGRDLKNAIHEIISDNVSMLSYGSGDRHTWWGFYVTDRRDDNTVVDRYSNDIRSFGSRGKSISGMNIEHSFPKSWWGGSQNNAYKDLYNLMPCESSINSTKSNYPMGIVISPTSKGDNGCTLVGKGSDGQNYWEPADKWKGDFARGYMYMATAYQNFTWQGAGLQILQQGQYPTLRSWAYTLFMKWARTDRVDDIEIKRNSDVESLQGNRNPFVDFPNLMEYIWGDSTEIAFHPATTVKSTSATGGITGGEWVTVASSTLMGDTGGFTVENTVKPSGNVWTNTADYGWKGSAFFSNACHVADATLWTPVLDMTQCRAGRIRFEHAINKGVSAPDVMHSVIVEPEGEEAVTVSPSAWPSGKNWNFVSATVSLDRFAGKRIRVGFRYTSTTSEAATWEIKNYSFDVIKNPSGIHEIDDDQPGNLYTEDSDFNAEPEYYTIDGRRIADPSQATGLVIVRRGSRAAKVFIRR